MPRWGFVTPIQPTQCTIFTLLSWCSISVKYHFNKFVGLYWIRATWTVNDFQPFINNMTSFGGRGVNGLLNKIKKVASTDINEQLTSSLESIGSSSSSFVFPVSSWSSLPRIFDIRSIISPQIMWISSQIVWSSSLLQTVRGHAETDVCAQLNNKCTMYHPADVRWDVLNDIMSSYYLHNHQIFGLNALNLARLCEWNCVSSQLNDQEIVFRRV